MNINKKLKNKYYVSSNSDFSEIKSKVSFKKSRKSFFLNYKIITPILSCLIIAAICVFTVFNNSNDTKNKEAVKTPPCSDAICGDDNTAEMDSNKPFQYSFSDNQLIIKYQNLDKDLNYTLYVNDEKINNFEIKNNSFIIDYDKNIPESGNCIINQVDSKIYIVLE